jgi:hypothetical protein
MVKLPRRARIKQALKAITDSIPKSAAFLF